MIKAGEIYKPSQFSFEDKDVRIEVYQVSMDRVLYTNLTTNTNGEISIKEFHLYYDKAESEEE